MKAGIDFGTTLIKAAWFSAGRYRFLSSADHESEAIGRQMAMDGVTQVNVSGINTPPPYFNRLEKRTPPGDQTEAEMKIRALGTKRILETQCISLDDFLLVSVGTGTSYTQVFRNGTKKFDIGSSLGGGFIYGLGKYLGAKNYGGIAEGAAQGTPLDILVKDVTPNIKSIQGELVVANFAKTREGSNRNDAYTSAISIVATAIARDILILGKLPEFACENVVYVGSTISRTPTLKKQLEQYMRLITKKPHFPQNGEFALALGAYRRE